jgi:S-formylglutathione hydrolase FrmB
MSLNRWCILATLLALAWPVADAGATGKVKTVVRGLIVDHTLHGTLVDLTHNHGHDKRIWSRSLHQWRDLYVYLPPGYDCNQQYPVMICLHGFASDEQSFLQLVPELDAAISCGKLPPLIIAAPDGSIPGHPCCDRPGSWWINSHAGEYEDWVLQDVWDYLIHHYSICTDRTAHVLAGVSMGGFGAFNLGMRHREAFGVVAGIMPPLNLRWEDCHGNRKAKFDPRCWGWRTAFDQPREIIGRLGVVPIRVRDLLGPVFGEGDAELTDIMANNPIELIDRTKLRNGELEMFIGYGGKDEFNIDAQVESFLYMCKNRGIGVTVVYDPNGHHNAATAFECLPDFIEWLAARLAPYSVGVPVDAPAVPAAAAAPAAPARLARPAMLP